MNVLNLYPSALARDAALASLPPAAWTGGYLTFSEFTAELDRLLPWDEKNIAARDPIGATGRMALMAQAVSDASTGELEQIAGSDRALSAASALLAAWKGVQLSPRDLEAAAQKLAADPAAVHSANTLTALAKLFELYENRLGKKFSDREAVERQLLRRLSAVSQLPPRLLKPGTSVALHGFHRLAYFQFRVVEELQRLKHDVTIHNPIFSEKKRQALSTLVSTFAGAKFQEITKDAPLQRVQRMEAPTLYAEVYEIGRRVRRWITAEKIKPSAIAVTFRDLGSYSQALHDVFKRLGIPFYERRGEPAAFQPLVRVCLSAIEACISGLDRRSVFRFLCSGPVQISGLIDPDSKIRCVPSDLNDLAIDAGIERFFGSDADQPAHTWSIRLLGRYNPDHPLYQSGCEKSERSAQARLLVSLIERLDAMRPARTAFAHSQAWFAFFAACGLHSSNSGWSAQERLALNAVAKALDVVASCPNAQTEPLSIAAYFALVTHAIQEQSVQADGHDQAGVRLLNFFDLRGLQFKRTVIGGLVDGCCPAQTGSDVLLGSGSERIMREALSKQLNDRDAAQFLEPRLGHANEEEELALFEIAAHSAQEFLLLSRPLQGADGRELGPSEFWDLFKSAPLEKTASIHPAPTLDECLTLEEAQLRAAWILGGGKSKQSTSINENHLATAALNVLPKLRGLAQSAAVEQARQTFFLKQALEGSPGEKRPETATCAGLYDGIVSTPGTDTSAPITRRLTPGGIGAPILSPSDFEKLADCPFRFLTERLCRFENHEEAGEELSSLDSGTLWHAVLTRFYKQELAAAHSLGHPVVRLLPKNRAAYLERLMFDAGKELTRVELSRHTGHPGLWKLYQGRLQAVLENWLDCELKEPWDGFHPAYIEFGFGPDVTDGSAELKVSLDKSESGTQLLVKGRMDRLDFKLESVNGRETVVALRVIDYKLGAGNSYKSKTKLDPINELRSAQLPLYLAASIQWLCALRDANKLAVDLKRVWDESRAGYYSLKDTPYSNHGDDPKLIEVRDWPLGSLKAFLDTQPTPDNVTLFDHIRARMGEALNGRFPVLPQNCAGSFCPSRYACRFQSIPAMKEED